MNFQTLNKRAELLQRLRTFFAERGFLEVETPLVSKEVIPEQHIGLFGVDDTGWLQASPEMNHKRMLCAGSGSIFEVTRSFRRGEVGTRHNPEFTIVEWYRPGDDMASAMRLLEELLCELLDSSPASRTSYREAFERSLGIDPHTATPEGLQRLAAERSIDPAGLTEGDDRDEWLNLLLSAIVEPDLGGMEPELLYHYPASQFALARTTVDESGVEVAERFELYCRGLEVANGYHELTDPIELRRRLLNANKARRRGGMPELPLPEKLLAEMTEPGLPPCSGVALGFDRLLMLATGATSISEVRAFAGEG